MSNQFISGDEALENFRNWLNEQEYSQIFILADSNTSNHCFPLIEEYLTNQPVKGVLEIPPGEVNKTIHCCEDVWEELLNNGADRYSLLINLGGGVISDLGGFIASTFKRGIDFVNLPTTLLAMTDAAIGGKTGINFRGLKNQLGTFYNPVKTVLYPPFLESLDNRQFGSGYAEMIKHALIASPSLWNSFKSFKSTDRKKVLPHLTESARIKQIIVEQDYREAGVRKKLNFGHTIGHALESYNQEYEKKPLFHGEAIALGMRVESYLSMHYHSLDQIDFDDIDQYLSKEFPDYKLPQEGIDQVMDYMRSDKKNKGETINFTLLSQIGKAEVDFEIEEEHVKNALTECLM